MTVIFYDNQNAGNVVTVDTLVLDSSIERSTAMIDLYYCQARFHIPYDLPTRNIYKDAVKDQECSQSILRRKCYTYDTKNRVIEMSVDGSGTMGTWHYTYDSLDRIISMQWLSSSYSIQYDRSGRLTELSEKNDLFWKRLEFKFR